MQSMSGRGWQRFLWTVLLPGLAGWGGGFCIYSGGAVTNNNAPVAGNADRQAAPLAADDESENPALRERVAALEKRLQEKHLKDQEGWLLKFSELTPEE